MFIKISGYSKSKDDEWVNPEHIISIHFDKREKRFDLRMRDGSDKQVSEPDGILHIGEVLGMVGEDGQEEGPA